MRIKTLNPNHVVVFTEHHITLFSYDTEVASLFCDGMFLGVTDAWDYSNVTPKNLYLFLREYCTDYIRVGKEPNVNLLHFNEVDNKAIKKFITQRAEEYGVKKVLENR